MMKKQTALLLAGMLLLTGCANNSNGGNAETAPAETTAAASQADGDMAVSTEDGFDEEYRDLIARYFTAIEHDDYEAYKAAVYPPYLEQYAAFLSKDGSDPETAFHEMRTQFDEDGYSGWHFTELELAYYPEENLDIDGFFNAYARAGIYDEAFIEATKKDAAEIKDVKFALYALYDGDEASVPVIAGKEILVLKNADGCYLFG